MGAFMDRGNSNPRIPAHEVDAIFTDRWSPRSFLEKELTDEQVTSLFETARWAPSCYNDQPWHFRYARNKADRALFAEPLVDKNRLWATQAPLLVYVVARLHFAGSSKSNRHGQFDAGAAWMALALQARRLGLYAHAMAGFDVKKAHALLNLPEDEHEVMAAIAVGYRGSASKLTAEMASMEVPNGRKSYSEVAGEGVAPIKV
jgi:nitroreductase